MTRMDKDRLKSIREAKERLEAKGFETEFWESTFFLRIIDELLKGHA